MSRTFVSSGSDYEHRIGYSRAVIIDDDVLVSGTTGFDYETMTISDDVVAQAEQCFHNIAWALAEAGCTLDDIVRVRYIFPDGRDFEPCWPVFRRHLERARPAATMIIAGLLDPRMKLEIEVSARRGAGA
ncbi:MAG: RidA family protein [Pseudomonadales bacterium]|nr:RidA family protein [Pseudomonadales bacterium]